jgi:hypothetical protein
MLIKWENFGAFLSSLLRQEIFLTGEVLSEFHCTLYVVKIVFVTLCRFYIVMLIYQNMKHLVLTELGGTLMFEIAPMQLLSDNKVDLTKLISIWALYLHIWDDYSNLCQEQVTSELSVIDG